MPMPTNTDAYVPMPNTAHPFYATQAQGIRGLIGTGRAAVEVFTPRPVAATFRAPGDPGPPVEAAFPRKTLTIKKCAGAAPFVGDPRVEQGAYFWRVAVDDLGRHVAADAELSIVPRSARA